MDKAGDIIDAAVNAGIKDVVDMDFGCTDDELK